MGKDILKEEYYVEFSTIQNCFHIDTLDKIKENNISLCERNISNGYVLLGGPFTYKEASLFCKKYEHLKHKG